MLLIRQGHDLTQIKIAPLLAIEPLSVSQALLTLSSSHFDPKQSLP
jgi:hypothetical protein